MYTAALAALAGVSLQGCKKSADMASLVRQAKEDINKKDADLSKILKNFACGRHYTFIRIGR